MDIPLGLRPRGILPYLGSNKSQYSMGACAIIIYNYIYMYCRCAHTQIVHVYVLFFHLDSELKELTDTSRPEDEHLEIQKSLLTEKLKQKG